MLLLLTIFNLVFKEKSSTTLCTSTVSEVARLYRSRGSHVYAVMLDATKAFDRIQYVRLFNILLDKGMDVLHVRLLLYMYVNQQLRIKWNGFHSETFCVYNGVKQGGVISPVLFGVYIDELIKRLRHSGYGCYVGPYFFGCIGYADDLVLLSPTKAGLEAMLSICKQYSLDYKVQFNGLKSQFIIFSNEFTKGQISIDTFGMIIQNQDSAIHLGHKLFSDLRSDDLNGIISSFYRQFNSFRCRFGAIASKVQANLFTTYCSSFYGCLLLPFKKIDKLSVTWRKSHLFYSAGLETSLENTLWNFSQPIQ